MRQTQLANFFNTPESPQPPPSDSESAAPAPKRRKQADNPALADPYTFKRDGQVIELSAQQRHVLSLVLRGGNIFYTGSAGVGKSLLLTAIVSEVRRKLGKSAVFITAATGVAACNIGGMTVHSFAGIRLGDKAPQQLVELVRSDPRARKRWNSCKVLVIDEISMIDAELFDKLDYVSKVIRRSPHAFGGIQLVICGDFLQLPPVPNSVYSKATGKLEKQPVRYCFESAAWKNAIPSDHCIELTQIFRQKDRHFIELLQAVRSGHMNPHHIQMLQARVGVELPECDGVEATLLYPHRQDVRMENDRALFKIKCDAHTFKAKDTGAKKYRTHLDKSCQAPSELTLKVGAQVVLLKNLDFSLGLVNGTRGVVIDFLEPSATSGDLTLSADDVVVPMIRFANGVVRPLGRESWRVEMGPVLLASRLQFPLMLCWACSIHKSQGLTLDRVKTGLAKVFAEGQAYVSLSRCTSLEGLSLVNFDPARIRANPRVLEFYRTMGKDDGATGGAQSQ